MRTRKFLLTKLQALQGDIVQGEQNLLTDYTGRLFDPTMPGLKLLGRRCNMQHFHIPKWMPLTRDWCKTDVLLVDGTQTSNQYGSPPVWLSFPSSSRQIIQAQLKARSPACPLRHDIAKKELEQDRSREIINVGSNLMHSFELRSLRPRLRQ